MAIRQEHTVVIDRPVEEVFAGLPPLERTRSPYARVGVLSELLRMIEPVEKVTAGPIYGPESDQKCPKSAFWCPNWVRSEAPQEFFNSLEPSTHSGE